MCITADMFDRVAVVTRLAQYDPNMGRTTLMKYAYLLQVVKKVPLGFDFRLHSYGPYDSDVLSISSYAKHLGAISEEPRENPIGVKMEIGRGPNAGEIEEQSKEFLEKHEEAIQWVVKNFSNYHAGQMELVGTVVYADQEAKRKDIQRSRSTTIDIVKGIKPWAEERQIGKIFDHLNSLDALIAIESA